jgi:steroid delta-isomerase-like uncharacterized protein
MSTINPALREETETLIKRYYQKFNAHDAMGMLGCLSDNIVHDVNQGERRKGKGMFASFMEHMNRCYHERLDEIVVMSNAEGTHAAAEFIVHGKYLATDEGLPPAKGQSYVLPGGAFFAIENGVITRVTTYYNLKDWMAQVAK